MAATQRRQDPFGGSRGSGPIWPTSKTFVGGTNEPDGFVHLGARLYDPSSGRFISDDPLTDIADPQSLNGYSYANNGPIASSDPSGLEHDSEGCDPTSHSCGTTQDKPHLPALPKPGGAACALPGHCGNGSKPKYPVAKPTCTTLTPEYCHSSGRNNTNPYELGEEWLFLDTVMYAVVRHCGVFQRRRCIYRDDSEAWLSRGGTPRNTGSNCERPDLRRSRLPLRGICRQVSERQQPG